MNPSCLPMWDSPLADQTGKGVDSMYTPSSLMSCCTALLHVLFQNPAALVLLGLIGISSVISVEKSQVPGNLSEQCSVQIRALEFSKGSTEQRRLDELTSKALQAFGVIPTGSPSETLVSGVLEKVGASSGGACAADMTSVMADPELLRLVMTLHFLDIVSTARDLREAITQYKKDTGQ